MSQAEITLRTRPSVQLLCSGVFLQAPVQLPTGESYVPLKPLGFENPARFLGDYVQFCGAQVDQGAINALIEQGIAALPCISIICPVSRWTSPQDAEKAVDTKLVKLRELISWATGNDVQPFGMVVLGPSTNEAYFRMIIPNGCNRTRLGFGNTGSEFVNSLARIITCADKDEHYAFALSMLHDANAEQNLRFKIARYFSCLESLAYRIKKGQGSRDAVRQLLGLLRGKTGQVSVAGRTYDYDVVLGAGKLRDFLYHSAPLNFSKSKGSEKDTFDLLQNHPEIYVEDLQSRVELEIARWSNGTSHGQFDTSA